MCQPGSGPTTPAPAHATRKTKPCCISFHVAGIEKNPLVDIMKWWDNLLGDLGTFHYRYEEGDEYPSYNGNPRQGSGSWHGPNIFEDPRGSGEGTSNSSGRPSYSNDRLFHPYDIPSYPYPMSPYHDESSSSNTSDNPPPFYEEMPPSNTNDRPTYNNERASHHDDPTLLEETDRAIALALSEEDNGRGRFAPAPDYDSDEELARAMQESLDFQYRAPHRTPDAFPIFVPPIASIMRPNDKAICAGCKQSLGYGRFLSCMGKNWHPNCFRCKLCTKPISDHEFSVQGTEAYHRHCYKELFHPKCEVCTEFIPTNAAGLIEYRSHPFWNQKYCPKHEKDGTPRCCSCDRIQAAGTEYATWEDGRKLCLECLETAVIDTKEAQPLYRDILKFYKNIGMMIDQEIPMLLVERSALNEAREGEKEGYAHTSETRGLCLSEEQTITTVFGGKPRFTISPSHMWTEPQKLVRHCEVTAILVLHGLPRLLTGSIIAHELMHAWLRLAGGFPHLRPAVEEGICQVMSHIWLTTELKKASMGKSLSGSGKQVNSASQQRLGEFILHQIATDSSPIYGAGFREGIAAVQQYGLVSVLEHMKLTANFP